MNEKILELADKAYNDNWKIIGHADIPDQFCYAFAELLVKECMDILETRKDHSVIKKLKTILGFRNE